jgi:hypothetical protein
MDPALVANIEQVCSEALPIEIIFSKTGLDLEPTTILTQQINIWSTLASRHNK